MTQILACQLSPLQMLLTVDLNLVKRVLFCFVKNTNSERKELFSLPASRVESLSLQ